MSRPHGLAAKWPWAFLGVMFCCVLAMNVFCLPLHDELSYAFQGQSTPWEGEVPRVASLGDILRQQIGDYLHRGNGRVFVHGLVAVFAGFRLYPLFDLCNTLMWFAFVWLILREGRVRCADARTFALGAAAVWWFLWTSTTCSMNAAFAVNYLWTATATLGMMALWRRLTRWWMVPVAFLYGWSQEAFALPMVAALAGGALIRSLVGRRLALTPRQAAAWCLMAAGVCFLILGPASAGRAAGILGEGLAERALSALRANASAVLLIWPAVLAAGLAWILWARRKALPAHFLDSLEWWLFLAASYGLLCVVGADAVVRLLLPPCMAAFVLILRDRDCLAPLPRELARPLLVVATSGMVAAAVAQTAFGCNFLRMIRLYRADPQGITSCASLPPGPLLYATDQSLDTDWNWHLMLLRRECGHPRPLAIFTPWLYETLYAAPETFFAQARPLDGTDLHVADRHPCAVAKRGDARLTPRQAAALDRHFAALRATEPTGLASLVPGRFGKMFPPPDAMLRLPDHAFTFTAKDGRTYTLFTPRGATAP